MTQVFSDEGCVRAALHTIEKAEVPEPGAIALLGAGIVGLVYLRLHKNRCAISHTLETAACGPPFSFARGRARVIQTT